MLCPLPNSIRSIGTTPRTYENKFRDDGPIAARPIEHLPKHALAWWRSPSNLPRSLTASGVLCRLNRETASRHTVAETCAAPLRRVLRLGYARTYRLTGQRKGKVVALERATPFLFWLSLYGWRTSVSPKTRCCASNAGTPAQLETVLVLSGGSFCFLLCLFSFTSLWTPSV
jgi:hypothetical protein